MLVLPQTLVLPRKTKNVRKEDDAFLSYTERIRTKISSHTWLLTYSNIEANQNTNLVSSQAFAMSIVTIPLQVWGKIYLPILVSKYGGKIWCQYGLGEGRHPWEDHTYQGDVCAPWWGAAHEGLWWECGKGGFTRDGEPACPAAPHPPKRLKK